MGNRNSRSQVIAIFLVGDILQSNKYYNFFLPQNIINNDQSTLLCFEDVKSHRSGGDTVSLTTNERTCIFCSSKQSSIVDCNLP